jgi:hypothetical protein
MLIHHLLLTLLLLCATVTCSVDKFQVEKNELTTLFGQNQGTLPAAMHARISAILLDINSPKYDFSENETHSDLNFIFFQHTDIAVLTSISQLFFKLLEYLSLSMFTQSQDLLKTPEDMQKIFNNPKIKFLIQNAKWSEYCLLFLKCTILRNKLIGKTLYGKLTFLDIVDTVKLPIEKLLGFTLGIIAEEVHKMGQGEKSHFKEFLLFLKEFLEKRQEFMNRGLKSSLENLSIAFPPTTSLSEAIPAVIAKFNL